jgi:site-specific recombinase XerD
MSTTTPGILIRSFFEDHLTCQKGLSGATIKTYRDALRLFLQYLKTLDTDSVGFLLASSPQRGLPAF